MNTASNERVSKILCGELCKSNTCTSKLVNLTNFDVGDVRANITTKYNKFVEDPHALSERTIDLLEIAAYVFCADRSINRGSRYSVKNNAWGRSLDFEIPVNDIDFWNAASVKNSLENALAFMTGDKEYRFSFTKAKATMLSSGTYQMSLFTMAGLDRAIGEDVDIMLFSGGLDSLAGAIDRLNTYPERNFAL